MQKRKCLILSLLLLFIFSGFSCSSIKQAKNKSIDSNGYQLVWADEFNYFGLPDSRKWNYDTEGNSWSWGNNELQYHSENRKRNTRVAFGKLHITARKENFHGKEYTSSRLITQGKGDWLYGKIEVRAKLPRGRGIWPAIWMLPSDWHYTDGPASGEIDIMEHVGYMPDTIYSTTHSLNEDLTYSQHTESIVMNDIDEKFHVYKLEWDSNQIKMLVDDTLYFTFNNESGITDGWPFNQPFHLLLNVTVGGSWGGLKGIDDSIFPQSMVIDYVRVYQKPE